MSPKYAISHPYQEALEIGKGYRDFLAELHTKYDEDYFVADIKLFAHEQNGFILMATWTDFMSVILPPVDYVSLVVSPDLIGVSEGGWGTYIMPLKELLAQLDGHYKELDLPTKHYVIEEIDQEVLKKQILDAASTIGLK